MRGGEGRANVAGGYPATPWRFLGTPPLRGGFLGREENEDRDGVAGYPRVVILPNMDLVSVALLVGLLLSGAGVVWLLMERGKCAAALAVARSERDAGLKEAGEARGEVARLMQRVEAGGAEVAGLQVELTKLRERLRAGEEVHQEREAAFAQREVELKRSITTLTEDFKAVFGKLSGEALEKASTQFLKLAESRLKEQQTAGEAEMEARKAAVDALIKPMGETLRKTGETLAQIEKDRTDSFATLRQQIAGVSQANEALRGETAKLARAMSRPEVRGCWGELQLRRVVQLAQMTENCDFVEQATHESADGGRMRPDMIVNLPNKRVIAVDAKAPYEAYLDAARASTEEERRSHLARFAGHMCDKITGLGRKQYWADLKGSVDFVVLFVPGDQLIDAALGQRGDLIERAAETNVLLASPGTLIALLRAVALGWREKRFEDEARTIYELARDLHGRAVDAYGHMTGLEESLAASVKHYNKFVGSYSRLVEPQFRKLEEADVRRGKEIVPALEAIAEEPRPAVAIRPLLRELVEPLPVAENGGS